MEEGGCDWIVSRVRKYDNSTGGWCRVEMSNWRVRRAGVSRRGGTGSPWGTGAVSPRVWGHGDSIEPQDQRTEAGGSSQAPETEPGRVHLGALETERVAHRPSARRLRAEPGGPQDARADAPPPAPDHGLLEAGFCVVNVTLHHAGVANRVLTPSLCLPYDPLCKLEMGGRRGNGSLDATAVFDLRASPSGAGGRPA